MKLKKVLGVKNMADAFTKYLTQATMEGHLHRMNLEFREGRAESGLQMQQNAAE